MTVFFFIQIKKMGDTCTDVLKCMHDAKFQKQLEMRLKSDTINVDSYNICRIHVHARTFDWTQPPNRNKGGSGTGTGFMLDAFAARSDKELFILTAHHVIAYSVQIRVNFAKISSEYVEASLVGCNADMDVALLVVLDKPFIAEVLKFERIGLKKGNSDPIRPPATVTAHGFALGKPHMQTTKGVVSGRIDSPSRLQTDVAVNPGNSGGPLLDENNHVIGIVTSGMVDAQGINYVAPIVEACVILERVLQKWNATGRQKYIADRLPCFNCSFTKSNRVLLDRIPNCSSGVFCTSVHPLIEFPQSAKDALKNLQENIGNESASLAAAREAIDKKLLSTLTDSLREFTTQTLMTRDSWSVYISNVCHSNVKDTGYLLTLLRNNSLQEGDIVCKMEVRGQSYEIDLQMTCKFPFWQDNLGFSAILDRLDCDMDTVRLKYFRNGDDLEHVDVVLRPQLNVFRKMHADVETVEYAVLGGIFVMPLLHNHIPLFRREPMHTLMNRPNSRHLSVLMITHILPESPFNECETIGAGDVLVGINNDIVNTLHNCVSVWDKESAMGEKHIITLRMRDGSLATASNSQIVDANQKILGEYKSKEYIGLHPTENETDELAMPKKVQAPDKEEDNDADEAGKTVDNPMSPLNESYATDSSRSDSETSENTETQQ